MIDQPKQKILVVGVGSIGERHVRCFQNTGRVDISICEVNDSLRAKVAERYGVQNHFRDLEAALALPHDAAVVAAPASYHIPIALQAAEAGLSLLIEKPLAVTTEGIAKLQRTVAEKKLVAVVAYVYRAHPALAEMKRAIDSNQFGRPVELVATAGQHFPTYRPAYRETYYCSHASGGGAIQDALTHIFNAGEWLLGPIDRLVADAAHQILEGVEVEDTVHVLARHDSVLASYALNQHQAPNESMITVNCERGTARFEFHLNRWRWMTDGDWQEPTSPALERDTLFTQQAEAFLDAIETNASPLCTLAEGLQTLNANLATLASVDQQKWQTVAAPSDSSPQ